MISEETKLEWIEDTKEDSTMADQARAILEKFIPEAQMVKIAIERGKPYLFPSVFLDDRYISTRIDLDARFNDPGYWRFIIKKMRRSLMLSNDQEKVNK
jgi:hypothetical protein